MDSAGTGSSCFDHLWRSLSIPTRLSSDDDVSDLGSISSLSHCSLELSWRRAYRKTTRPSSSSFIDEASSRGGRRHPRTDESCIDVMRNLAACARHEEEFVIFNQVMNSAHGHEATSTALGSAVDSARPPVEVVIRKSLGPAQWIVAGGSKKNVSLESLESKKHTAHMTVRPARHRSFPTTTLSSAHAKKVSSRMTT